jgi:heme/copper-type cytochrome/quinol oxidase subunit 2
MAGGRENVEAGLQTGLDIVATMVWWDWQTPEMLEAQEQDANAQTDGADGSMSTFLVPLFWLTLLSVVFFLAKSSKDSKE